jgi:M6 family metalloprotease-like protein
VAVHRLFACLVLATALVIIHGLVEYGLAERAIRMPATGTKHDTPHHITLHQTNLRRAGLHRGRMLHGGSEGCLTLDQSDPIQKVVAIRVDFIPDTVSTTTGTGQFDLSTGSGEEINPPPHDRDYFQHQMEALKRYYFKVSRGIVDFSCVVFPEVDSAAYGLPHQMSYYSPNLTEEENDIRLAEFFRDAIEAADAADEFDFSSYDAVVIFHAGVGADISFGYDDTPNDIPSAFMDAEWLAWALGSQYEQGVPVAGGDHHVPEGLWMPETLNQQDIEFGLTGLMAKLFGHQLGLPNLYNSTDGSSGIGTWGLMDQGSGNELGLIPAVPCAWSRVFLGWEQPVVVRRESDVAIDALMSEGEQPRVVKVPINADEYFLLENRQRDVFADSAVAIEDDEVIIEIDEYDWGLPGSGLLIWHVDEKVIRENYESNTVNADPLRRGVDLEEADGFQDIGFVIYGAYVTYGLPEDAFYEGNNTEFTPDSNPNSNSNDGADSHISVTGIGPSEPTMTCDIDMELYQPGWPDSAGVSLVENPPLVGDLDGDGDVEVVINTPDGSILAWHHDGTPLREGQDPPGLFVQLTDSLAGCATLGDINGDLDLEIIVGDAAGWVHCYDQSGEELPGFPFDLGGAISATPMVIPMTAQHALAEIVAGNEHGEVYGLTLHRDHKEISHWMVELAHGAVTRLVLVWNQIPDHPYTVVAGGAEGYIDWFSPFGEEPYEMNTRSFSAELAGLATGDLDRDENVDIIATNTQGKVSVWNLDGELLPGWPMATGSALNSSPVLGDVDGDGYLEVVVAGTDQIWAWNYNGTPVSDFPATISQTDPVGTLRSSPVLGDVDGDGSIDIVAGTPQGLLVAYNHFGQRLDGWPLACAGAVNASPTLADLDGDGDIELLAGDGAGWMYVWDLPARPEIDQLPWPVWGHDVRHTGAYPQGALPPAPAAGKLMPAASVYNYPNPTQGQSTTIRYTLGQEAEVHIRIYDLSGDLVDELVGTGYAHTENEVNWDLADVASGVYLCRVEARGSGNARTTFCKIAVVK